VVLDHCAGVGTTGMACKELGRSFILIEINPAYYAIAKNRLDNIGSNLFQSSQHHTEALTTP
jgi:site-specific DNA-methyltransferase (adenine-specific)